MSDEQKPDVRHVFDGIEELDNRLPNWWVGMLWGTILFAFGYWFYYQPTGWGRTSRDAYLIENAKLQKKLASAPITEDVLVKLVADPKAVGDGNALFTQNCAACHAAEGQGLIGPNLTDKFWLHGGKPTDIANTIRNGFVEKGMPAWGKTLGPERVKVLAAYVISLKGKNLPGKAPQGDPVE